MRILHINCNYLGNRLHQSMIEHLDALGLENQVYVPTFDLGLIQFPLRENVTVSRCFQKRDRLVFDYKQNKIFRDIEKKLPAPGFDVIHAYTVFTDGNIARKLWKKYGVPYVVAVRNTDVNDFFRCMPHLRGRGLKILKDAQAIFFLSETYREQVFLKYIPQGMREELRKKSHLIPNGIDHFWLENSPADLPCPPKREIRLLYAGRIDRNKNVPTTQKAAEILRKKGYEVTFTVVGKAEDLKERERISRDPHTTVLDAQPKEELIRRYRENHIFVMPSFAETFGLVYAEAMSQGLPVIYTKGQGFDGQFPEGDVGFAIDATNPEEVALAIEKILPGYSDMARRSLSGAKAFSWGGIAQRYCEIYGNLLSHKKN